MPPTSYNRHVSAGREKGECFTLFVSFQVLLDKWYVLLLHRKNVFDGPSISILKVV
jgi:hypothetical protein